MFSKTVRALAGALLLTATVMAAATAAAAQQDDAVDAPAERSAAEVLAVNPTALSASSTAATSRALPAVDLNAYAGVWYEAARTPNPFQDNRPEFFGATFSECLDTSVVYTVTPFSTIDLVNSCQRVDPVSGFEYTESIAGGAFPVVGFDGQLKVAFGPAPWPFFIVLFGFGADYWVYDLGPIVDGQYQWAIVSGPDPATASNFILTRTPTVSEDVRAEIIDAAIASGIPVDQLVERRR
jgi:apolipoprotein D and lipocalin family protein